MPKVLLVDPFLATEEESFRRLLPESVALAIATSYDDGEFARLAADADVLVNTLRRIDAATLALAPRARFVQQFGVGYDPVDLAAVNAANVLVAYNPGVNAAAVAEHTLMLMLALIKDLAWSERWARQGQFMLDEDAGSGHRRPGRRHRRPHRPGRHRAGSCRRGCARSAHVSSTHAQPASRGPRGSSGRVLDGAPDLLRLDIVSLHVPLPRRRITLIGDAELALMPRGSFLINTARGGLVDEAALRRAIEVRTSGRRRIGRHRGRIGRAQPLCRPAPGPCHAASGGRQPRQHRRAWSKRSAANICRFLAGEPVHDLIPGINRV